MHWRFKRKDGYKHRHHLGPEIKNHYNGSTLHPSILLLRVEEKLKCRAAGACNEIENINSCLSCATDAQRTTSATLAQITAALHCFLSPESAHNTSNRTADHVRQAECNDLSFMVSTCVAIMQFKRFSESNKEVCM